RRADGLEVAGARRADRGVPHHRFRQRIAPWHLQCQSTEGEPERSADRERCTFDPRHGAESLDDLRHDRAIACTGLRARFAEEIAERKITVRPEDATWLEAEIDRARVLETLDEQPRTDEEDHAQAGLQHAKRDASTRPPAHAVACAGLEGA